MKFDKVMMLRDMLSMSKGKRPPERTKNGKYPIFGANGVIGRCDHYNAEAGTIIVGRVGSSGSVHFSPTKCWVSDNAIAVQPKDGHSVNFLFYLLGSLGLQDWSGGSTQPLLNQSTIASIEVTVPPRDAQHKIAEMLQAFDRNIQLLQRMNATLESIAQAVFKSWFIDFDPVHAKAAGWDPVGMDAETAALFPSEFEDSGLGPIPAGWDMRTVSEIGTVITGKTPSTREATYYGSDVPFITIPDMHDATFVEYTGRSLSNLGAASQQAKMLPPLSVCVSCIATPGLVSLTAAPSQTNQQINSIICNDDVSPYYAYLYMKQLREHLIVLGSGGSATLNVNKGQFEKISLLIPSPGIMKEFARIVQPLFSRILNNVRLARTLGNLRDTLLPRLISGRLRIPEAEEIVQEAVS